MVSVAGFAASVNPLAAAALTVNWNVVVLSAWPVAVPLTVTVAVPVVAFAAAARVSADELPVALCGSNAAVTPAGRPVAVSATAPSKPPVRVMLTVCVAVAPCVAVTVGLATPSEKVCAGAATTVIASGAVTALTPLPVALTVALVTPGVAAAAALNVMTADVALLPIEAGSDV